MTARLRVMTYNIRNGRGADGVVDLDRIAAVIASYGPDVVAIQEVDVGRPRSGALHQPEELARRLAMTASYGACIERGEERYGIATLTRLPLLEARRIMLPLPEGADPDRRAEPRCALVTRIDWDRTVVTVVNTHLSVKRRERALQVTALVEAVGDTPLVIAGDFNCTRFSGAFRRLCYGLRPATRHARTWPARLPVIEIDHILYRPPLQVVSARAWTGAQARRASDHLPVVAELTLAPGAAA